MEGDETERFCTQCGRSVHNLSSLTIAQKLAILRGPRSDLCARYRIAIRQAVPGREPAYFEHLVKYGAGVALASAVFVTLWEVSADADRTSGLRRFRVAPAMLDSWLPMAPELYDETNSVVVGGMVFRTPPPSAPARLAPPAFGLLDIVLSPVELQKLLPAPPPPPLPAIAPLRVPQNK